jgi:hypothetical protein
MNLDQVKIRVTDNGGAVVHENEFAMESGKAYVNDALSKLVASFKGAEIKEQEEELEEIDPAANEEIDALEEQLNKKAPKKRIKQSVSTDSRHPMTRLHEQAVKWGVDVKSIEFAKVRFILFYFCNNNDFLICLLFWN